MYKKTTLADASLLSLKSFIIHPFLVYSLLFIRLSRYSKRSCFCLVAKEAAPYPLSRARTTPGILALLLLYLLLILFLFLLPFHSNSISPPPPPSSPLPSVCLPHPPPRGRLLYSLSLSHPPTPSQPPSPLQPPSPPVCLLHPPRGFYSTTLTLSLTRLSH